MRLAEISTVITGGTPSKTHPEYYGGEFPFYKPADIINRGFEKTFLFELILSGFI